MYAISAAHKTLPFGTFVRIRNLENGRRLDVRINDRGPFVRGRIIDLSYGAAKRLGIVGPGTAHVEIVALYTDRNVRSPAEGARRNPPVDYRQGNFTFQVGAFLKRENAEQLRAQLVRKYKHVHIAAFDDGVSTYYRVRVGRFTHVDQARQKEAILIADGYEPIIVAE
jgi:rare lipoprotein A